ncbi:MAG: hypothetical protein KKD05_02255, partial [Candidatus Omnitrophica bacterium]|nr:hypothetical protein [Candidatus Omnitrophota bacterium]
MKAKILFKFIAVCLIQTIVLADVCLAQTVFVNSPEFKTEYLAAKLAINISLFEQAFDESYASALSADEPKNFDNVIFSITKENIKAI